MDPVLFNRMLHYDHIGWMNPDIIDDIPFFSDDLSNTKLNNCQISDNVIMFADFLILLLQRKYLTENLFALQHAFVSMVQWITCAPSAF